MDQNRGQQALREWMVANGHNQTTFAKLVNMRQSAVSDLLRGRYVSLERALSVRAVTSIPVEAWVEPAATSRRKAS